jgi:hypothetical protein
MDDVSRKNKHRPPQSRTAAGQRPLKPGASGSFIRRRLVGAVPVERLPEPTRALVEEAVELDRRLLSRGWIFEESMASPNVLAWPHGGDPARLLKFMQQLPVRVRDRTGEPHHR